MPSRKSLRLPPWLKVSLPREATFGQTQRLMDELRLQTVCRSARCPNIFECFTKGRGTFLIMGTQCTRNCRFCNIENGPPTDLDPGEPVRVSQAVGRLGIRHAVITSVTRDDLKDGGAAHFCAVIHQIRVDHPGVAVEVLIPDFQGSKAALELVVGAGPTVLNHNVETVPRLYPQVRPEADYAQSLKLLAEVRAMAPGMRVKSGLMVGLGETDQEIRLVVDDLATSGCDMITIGQYLRPTRRHLPVDRYVPPRTFDEYAVYGRRYDSLSMFCGPLVRSSYQAEECAGGATNSRMECTVNSTLISPLNSESRGV